ncbi:hypothetical protein BDZ91DRAFT_329119 [Kalaharituber pfeilii]|nr:hypothetical protein BDZ91DRAFT_329119 [Kalaharituber pfeilii]
MWRLTNNEVQIRICFYLIHGRDGARYCYPQLCAVSCHGCIRKKTYECIVAAWMYSTYFRFMSCFIYIFLIMSVSISQSLTVTGTCGTYTYSSIPFPIFLSKIGIT